MNKCLDDSFLCLNLLGLDFILFLGEEKRQPHDSPPRPEPHLPEKHGTKDGTPRSSHLVTTIVMKSRDYHLDLHQGRDTSLLYCGSP